MMDRISAILGGPSPVFILIAGPNGSGKSTYTLKRLAPVSFPCINPDEIAKDLYGPPPHSSEDSLVASKIATDAVRQNFAKGQSIALETVFSDSHGHKLALIGEAKKSGFQTLVIYIGLESVQLCCARVFTRVLTGGHDIPDDLIAARYKKSMQNLIKAIPVVDGLLLVDNSNADRHREFAYAERGRIVHVDDVTPSRSINLLTAARGLRQTPWIDDPRGFSFRRLRNQGVDSQRQVTRCARARPQPAQHESCFTSLVKVWAASFSPSTMVRYGNN